MIKSEVIIDENWFLSDIIVRIIKFLLIFFGIDLVSQQRILMTSVRISEDGKIRK